MTAVVDISCPECSAVRAVRKVGVGTYRCDECDAEFSAQRVLSSVRDAWDEPPGGG